MKIYWNLNSIPEMEGLSKEERKRAWSYAYIKCFRHWQTYLGIIICGLCAGLVSSVGGRSLLADVIGGAIGGAIGVVIFCQLYMGVAREYLAEWKTKEKTSDQDGVVNSVTAPPSLRD